MTPSPETCRQLTIYLGECFHEWYWIPGGGLACKNCPIDLYRKDDIRYEQVIPVPQNRTFTTPTDLFAVYGKIYADGKWDDFQDWAFERYEIGDAMGNEGEHWYFNGAFTAWLFCLAAPDQIGERMEMAAAFLKERER